MSRAVRVWVLVLVLTTAWVAASALRAEAPGHEAAAALHEAAPMTATGHGGAPEPTTGTGHGGAPEPTTGTGHGGAPETTTGTGHGGVPETTTGTGHGGPAEPDRYHGGASEHHVSPLVEPLENCVKLITLILARLVEMFAGIIIGVASLKAIFAYFRGYLAGGIHNPDPEVRIALGRALALALELELGADILGTAVAPTWNDIGQLAAIAVLRTALNYSLEREMHAEEQHHLAQHPPRAGEPPAPHAH